MKDSNLTLTFATVRWVDMEREVTLTFYNESDYMHI